MQTLMDDKGIFYYAREGDLEGVKKRVALKGKSIINTEIDSKTGHSALTCASQFGHLPLVSYLLRNGAHINHKTNDGFTPLLTAIQKGHLSIVQCLISNGTSINDKTGKGNTALIIASEKGHLEIVQYLVTHSPAAAATINTQNNYGSTALHWAGRPDPSASVADSTAMEIIATLIAHGADGTIRDNNNRTPAQTAKNDTLRIAIIQAALDKTRGELQSLQNELTREKAARRQEGAQLENQLSTSQQLLATFQKQLSTTQQDKIQLQAQLNQEKSAHQQTQQKVTRLEQEITSLRHSSSSASLSASSSPLPGDDRFVLPLFPYASLSTATNNFSNFNKLGEGGFGSVFKGFLLGTQVAIKILAPDSRQGHKEFKAEITSLSRFRHPNIVNLIGFAEQGIAKSLVYEFVSNGSLRDRLDRKDYSPSLTWSQREFIAIGIATGMNYLQNADPQAPFFHLDLKSANVLLDENFKPKLSDFGLTRPLAIGMGDNSYVQGNVIEGDISYICPEYLTKGKVSRKTDVYSYGCILIELISGQFVTSQLRTGIRNVFLKKRDISPLLDGSLSWDNSLKNKAIAMATLAVDCIEENRFERPSFAKIIQDLSGSEIKQLFSDQIVIEDDIERECYRCFNGPTDAKFIPCNHAAVCQKCAQGIKDRNGFCPICLVRIQDFAIGDFKTTFSQ